MQTFEENKIKKGKEIYFPTLDKGFCTKFNFSHMMLIAQLLKNKFKTHLFYLDAFLLDSGVLVLSYNNLQK
jgi:hypothetical protein